MKALLLTITLTLSVSLSNAQLKTENPYGARIIQIFEDVKAIESMLSNKTAIEQQLLDVEQWSANGAISEDTYQELQHGYTAYSNHMNAIVAALCEDLRTIPSLKKMKGRKLEKLMKDFSQTQVDKLLVAKELHSNEWQPAFAKAADEADSKAIIPVIIFILEFGDTIFSSLKDLFETGSISRENRNKLFNSGMDIAVNRIENKLKYPKWNELVSSQPEPSNLSNKIVQQPTTLAPARHNAVRELGSVELVHFQSQEQIPLATTSKNIIVGEEMTSKQLPLFSCVSPLNNGTKFQVKLGGYSHAYFFYFDEQLHSWQDPYGKSIIVGSDATSENVSTVTLPGNHKFFEITGDSTHEEFLILISNTEMDNKQRIQLMQSKTRGVIFLESLKDILGAVYSPIQEASDISKNSNQMNTLHLSINDDEQGYYPVYIRINKV